MTNKDLSLELLEIKLGIHAIAEKQEDDSTRTTEIYTTVFKKDGLVTDMEKTKIQIANIEGWKKNINKIIISTITAIIVGILSMLFIGNANSVNFSKFFN